MNLTIEISFRMCAAKCRRLMFISFLQKGRRSTKRLVIIIRRLGSNEAEHFLYSWLRGRRQRRAIAVDGRSFCNEWKLQFICCGLRVREPCAVLHFSRSKHQIRERMFLDVFEWFLRCRNAKRKHHMHWSFDGRSHLWFTETSTDVSADENHRLNSMYFFCCFHLYVNVFSGLDPALPMITKALRLTYKAAHRVHTIQTNAGFYGDIGSIGHVDVCVNNGNTQPFCTREKSEIEKINIELKINYFLLWQIQICAVICGHCVSWLKVCSPIIDWRRKNAPKFVLTSVFFNFRLFFRIETTWKAMTFPKICYDEFRLVWIFPKGSIGLNEISNRETELFFISASKDRIVCAFRIHHFVRNTWMDLAATSVAVYHKCSLKRLENLV